MSRLSFVFFSIFLFSFPALCVAGVSHIPPEICFRQQQENANVLLVDIRKAKDFSHCHIKGSINIDPTAVFSRFFLKNKEIVLVYGGINSSTALSLAEKAASHGWSPMSILKGGIAGWADQGLPLQEQPGSRKNLYALNSRDVYQLVSKKLSDVILLDLRSPGAFARNGISTAINFPFSCSEENLQKQGEKLADYLRKLNRENSRNLVLISQDGMSGRVIDDFRKKYDLKNLFFLQGGMDEYRGYLKQMKSVLIGRKNFGQSHQPECR
jgi:rhodanese-related sulfurtransferase